VLRINHYYYYSCDSINHRAPTWSWASIESKVDFRMPLHFETLFKVIEPNCSPVGSDLFGEVSSGYVNLSASLVRAHQYRRITIEDGKDAKFHDEVT
jgi:hypothetical protein